MGGIDYCDYRMFKAIGCLEEDGILLRWIIIFFLFRIVSISRETCKMHVVHDRENKYFNTTNNAWKIDKQRVNFKDSSF